LTAVVSIITGFDPASSTSVMEKQLRIFPSIRGRSQRSFCASVPYLWRISMFPASGAWQLKV